MFSSSSSLASAILLLLLLLLTSPVSAVWPAPQSFSKGNTALYLHQNIKVTYNGGFVRWSPLPVCPSPAPGSAGTCFIPDFEIMEEYRHKYGDTKTNFTFQTQLPYTYGYVPADSFSSREIVQAGVSRALGSILSSEFVPWMLYKRNKLSEFEPPLHGGHHGRDAEGAEGGRKWLTTLEIFQKTKDTKNTFKPLAGEVDESYNLTISKDGAAKLTAVSSVGVLRGLETFVQLFYRHSGGAFWYTPYAPVDIKDWARFPHRGILMDTARNWFDVKDILRTIDAMTWNKLNRLHVHVTDSQSWPLEIRSMPEVAKQGAYRPDLTYKPGDIEMIQKYGLHRGVQVYFEIDMPGHIGSVALSHPELIVAYNEQPYWWWCAEPPCGAFKLNDNRVDKFLDKLWDDLLPRVAPYTAYFHTGGDELNANDSMLDEGIRSNKSEVLQPLLQKFIDKQHARIRKAGLTPMTWEEIPVDWNVTIGKDVVVQSWLGGDSVKDLTAKGHKVIDSNYNYLYLDCGRGQWINMDNGVAFETFFPFPDWCDPYKNWRLIYTYDPTTNLTVEQAKLVLGGEVAVWAETIDPVTFDSIVWPRASAAGEVWWSGNVDPATGQNRSQLEVTPRLAEMRERMVARGVRSSPVQMIFCTQATPEECSYPM
ncbi:glycoside hydrolase superfamily [Apodospora peruviana]|uniref:Beta-hexosaminidase n=1 Tax=Apodospora peruviana TaxID=516989 RepID=A0AAE0IPE1_9PEZI|nr:glycoside hydrolase superfamily [Apodospora peruviana]